MAFLPGFPQRQVETEDSSSLASERMCRPKTEAAAEDAKKLAGLFKEVEAFWTKSNTADAIALAQAAQKASSEAAASAKANNFEQASAAVGSIGKNCKGCHDAHKPKK